MGTIGSVWIIPFLTSTFGFAAIFIPYYVAVNNGHVPLLVPFIRRNDLWWRRISFSLSITGISGAFLVTSTVSFSVADNLLIHTICAMMAFLLVTLYVWGQVLLSFILSPRMSGPFLNWARFVLALSGTSSLILCEMFINYHIISDEIACFTHTFLPGGYDIPATPNTYSPQFIDLNSPVSFSSLVSSLIFSISVLAPSHNISKCTMVNDHFIFIIPSFYVLRSSIYIRKSTEGPLQKNSSSIHKLAWMLRFRRWGT
ncbi:hypothetical protein PRIPAC_78800 [Pristionchus pacificus]|uniref:CWH43-like N-terminal domain-containing protein n=1 Tax=Pristionchus pacificus TaxID=54126 RepID=A0A2A6BY36_PRIPA|nr:hypothetical protein PRIPAC_78800 [Pristionchus pacificus]|eukprot:PDM70922.1 hypothetical protein PRIPAC_44318 [Pristionchus pacificus]